MTYRPAALLALFLLACGPSNLGSDDEVGETGDEDEHPPVYLLTDGVGSVWVVDVTEPGSIEAAKIVPETEEWALSVVESPSSRWAALVTGAAGNASASVWLHDFVEAPLEPAVEIAIDPATSSAQVWFAEDESGLVIETATQLGERELVYVPLGEGGPGPSIEVPDVPGAVYEAGFAGGSHFVTQISDAGTMELHVSAIVDGQPQAPVRLPEFDGTRTNAKWYASGDFLIYDTIDCEAQPGGLTSMALCPEGSMGQLHRVDLSAWPEHEVETLGPFPWTNTGVHWWVARDGSRLILRDQPLQVAKLGDAIATPEVLPDAVDFIALSDDGRFGLLRGPEAATEIHQMLVFDFESATPFEPHSLGTTRSNIYDVAFGGDWAVWTTGDCAAGGVDLSGDLAEVVPLTDVDRLFGFGIASGTNRLYSKGATFGEPGDPEPPPELSFRELDSDLPEPILLAHPLEDGTSVAELVASPVDDRHFYEVVDENNTNAELWEHDPVSGVRTPIGALNGSLHSLWAPGSSVTRPVVLQIATSCSN